jgi:hypothetical protein
LRSVTNEEFASTIEASKFVAKRFCKRSGGYFILPGFLPQKGFAQLWSLIKLMGWGKEFSDLRVSIDIDALGALIESNIQAASKVEAQIQKDSARLKSTFLIGLSETECEIISVAGLGSRSDLHRVNYDFVREPLARVTFAICEAMKLLEKIPELVASANDGDDFLRAQRWDKVAGPLLTKPNAGIKCDRVLASVTKDQHFDSFELISFR